MAIFNVLFKNIFHFFFVFVLSFSLQGCLSGQDESTAELETIVLQLKWKHQFQFAGYYAAVEQGYYEEMGLDVHLVEAPDGVEPAQIVLDGGADFGIAASDLLLLRAKGEPVVALAAIYQHSPLVLLSVAGRNVDNVHDLAGKPVMIEAHAAELMAYLESEGISQNELTLLPHSFNPEALILDQATAMSAYSTDEPFLLTQAGLEYQIFNPRSSGIDFYGDTLFTTESQIQDHPHQVSAFLTASLRGWAYALDHPEEMVELIYTGYSHRHSKEHLLFEAKKTQQLILPDVVEIGYMNPGRWQRIGEIYSEMGMVSPGTSLDDFIYDRDPKPDLTWLYFMVLGVLIVLGISSFISARFYRLNSALHIEMDERAKTEQNLRVLEKRYRILAENAPFPIVISHLETGELLYINPKAAQKFEITQQHALGKSVIDFYVDPKDREIMVDKLDRHGFLQNFEVQQVSSGGNKFWADLSASIITFEDNPATFFSIVDITERRRLAIRLEEIAMKDDLTGIANRRNFMQKFQEEFTRARRYQTPLALLLLDTDNFKSINDTYGHLAGDQVLRQAAQVFSEYLRENDYPGRIGGDEFGIILPNTGVEDALNLAERLRQILSQQRVEIYENEIQFAMSIGVSEFHGNNDLVDDLIRRADEALYQAKNAGRNQVAQK
jgi:diguanylate cyclase (GGDEF)-like protein/PAS domain S-box-containing protein